MVSVIVFLTEMTSDLKKLLKQAAAWIFTAIFIGSLFAQKWLDNAYWLPPTALFVIAVFGLLAVITADKFKSRLQKLISRLPIFASFLVLSVCTLGMCFVLFFGLSLGLRVSKKYFPKSGPSEAHGTTDGVNATVQHPAQPLETLKQPADQPNTKPTEITKQPAKPTVPKPQPTIIQTQAPYGNLATRCEELGNAIVSTTDWRMKSRPDPATHRLEYNEWYRQNDGLYFHGPYYRHVAKIHKELADLHVDDSRLDELIERHESYFALRQQMVQQAIDYPMNFHLSIEEIREIGERFKQLATQIPH
jgi:hypothetical protein